MIMEFVRNHVWLSSILTVGVISIFLQWIMNLILIGYVKATANMKTTKNKMMIHLKNQFEAMYGMNCSVRNVAAYVDKYLLKLRFLGGSFSFWEKVPILSAGLITLVTATSMFYIHYMGGKTNASGEILFSYGIVLVCLFMFSHIFGIKSKKEQMQIQLVDYLENYLMNRMTKNQDYSKEQMIMEMEDSVMKKVNENEEMSHVVLEEDKELEEILQSEKNSAELEAAAGKELTDVDLLEEFVQSFLA